MPAPEQKDPIAPAAPVGGSTSAGTSSLSTNEKLALYALAVLALILYFFKH